MNTIMTNNQQKVLRTFHCGRIMRYAVMLVMMMVVGVSGAWGQAGIWYIANTSRGNANADEYTYDANSPSTNYYLVPAADPKRTDRRDAYYSYDEYVSKGDPARPFITTYKTNRDNNSIWLISLSGEPGYYFIIHAATGKYLIYEPPHSAATNRKSMHLQTVDTETYDPDTNDDFKFKFETTTNGYTIRPYRFRNDNSGNRFFNVANRNFNYYYGPSGTTYYHEGIVGLYTSGHDWYLDDASNANFVKPVISDVNESTSTVTISFPTVSITHPYTTPLTEDIKALGITSIIYTTNGYEPTVGGATTSTYSSTIYLTESTTVKARGVYGNNSLTPVVSKTITKVATPTYFVDESGITIQSETGGATIYYATSTDGGITYGSYSEYDGTPITGLAVGTYIKARATKAGSINSDESAYIVRQLCAAPTITVMYNVDGSATVSITNNDENGATVYYTTDGSVPTSSATHYSEAFNVTSGLVVKAVAVNDGYNDSNVASVTITQVATPVITIGSSTITISCETADATIYYIIDSGEPAEYTAALGLSDNVSGHAITAYATKSEMVKSANAEAAASTTKLTLPAPAIAIENGTVTFSTDPVITGVTYKYTFDESSTPTDETTSSTSSTITIGAPAIVKVIATHPNYVTSDVASSDSYLIPTNVPVLLQQKECISFFLTQAKVVTTNGTDYLQLTTTNIPDDNIVWHFEETGESGAYYLVKGPNSDLAYREFLCYNSTDNVLYLKSYPENSEKTKFVLDPYIKVDGVTYFNFQVQGQIKYMHKSNGNSSANYVVLLSGESAATFNKSLWGIHALPANKEEVISLIHPLSFNTSNTTRAYYYRIQNVNDENYYFTPPDDPATDYVKGGTAISGNTTVWYLKEAPDAAPLTTYYYVVNAATGFYLYYSGTAAGSNNAAQIKAFDSSNADKYKFIVAQTANGSELTPSGRYVFIPKDLQAQPNMENNSLALRAVDKKDYTLKTSGFRASNLLQQWTFVTEDLFCNNPVFDGSGENITISCPTDVAEIRYTINGDDPSLGGVSYSVYPPATPLSTSDQYLIKAYAVVSDGSSSVPSAVVTLFNNPDVTLSQDTYTYDQSAHEPTASKVAITISETEYEALATYDIDGYDNNINAGTATVNLVDTDPDDNTFFSHFSQDFTIEPRTGLTVTPDADQTKEYGDPDPVLTYTYSGLLPGDELTGSLSREAGEEISTPYEITLGDLGNPNYTATITTGKTFTITGKRLGDGTNPAPNITCHITKNGDNYDFAVMQGETTTLTAGTSGTEYDYEITSEDNTDPKYYVVSVTGANNYYDSFTIKYAKVNFSKASGDSSPGGAGTFVSRDGDDDYAVPANMSAYIVTGINASAGTIVVEEVNNIPEEVPVLLLSTVDADGFVVQAKDDGTPPVGSNMLKVKDADWVDVPAATFYLLYKGEFVLNAAGTLEAGKIYLDPAGGGAGVAPYVLGIDRDQMTDIQAPHSSTLDNNQSIVYYTLDGCRLSGKPTRKGIYITNGRKVIVP